MAKRDTIKRVARLIFETCGRAFLLAVVCATWYIFGRMEGENRQWAALVWGCWATFSVVSVLVLMAHDRTEKRGLQESLRKANDTCRELRRSLLRQGGIEPVGQVQPVQPIKRIPGKVVPITRGEERGDTS